MLITEIAVLDEVLHAHGAALGGDFAGYRNHTYRMANFCLALLAGDTPPLEKVAVASAFHDIGIWTAETFDYLEPSIAAATQHLLRSGREEWIPEIVTMIREHHKLRAYRGEWHRLAEPFRRADLVDVSHGLVRFGLSRNLLREAFAAWPDEGFHWRLVQLSLRRLLTHPWSPLPMVRV
jgi:hypothetical protein